MVNSVMSLYSSSSMISGSPGRKISTVPRTKSPLPYLERNRKIVGCLSCKQAHGLAAMMTDIQPVLEGDLLTNQLHFISSMVGRRGRRRKEQLKSLLPWVLPLNSVKVFDQHARQFHGVITQSGVLQVHRLTLEGHMITLFYPLNTLT